MNTLISYDDYMSSHFSQWVGQSHALITLFKIIGEYSVYLVPVLLVYFWFAISRKDALKAAVAGLLAWEGLSKLIAHFVHRARPDMANIGTKELIFHRPDTSFPSDHSAFLAAVALTFWMAGHKKTAWFVIVIAILTGIGRVGLGVHFPGDILAGWITGVVMVGILYLIDKPLDQYIFEPLVRLARKFHL